jgi:5-methyltetrahydropteroyltriglutamate--homocysteine methyltransferase
VKRSTDRIRTTHIGSLPRATALMDALHARNTGEQVPLAAFDAAVATAVDEVVGRQLAAGLAVVNDGEQSKFAYLNYHLDRLSGFEVVGTRTREEAEARPQGSAAERADFPEFFARWKWATDLALRDFACTGPVAYVDVAAVDRDIEHVLASAERAGADEVFMTALSPAMVWSTPNRHYPDDATYHRAVCDAMKVEYERITGAGIVLQVDSPDLGLVARSTPGATVDDHRRRAAYNIEMLNHATRDIDPDMVRVHVCWGADEAPHHHDTPLEHIVDVLLGLRPNGLTIVGANGRHEYEWEVWRDVDLPADKVIIPGVIDSTTNIIEHPRTVASRIERYVSVLGREHVIAGVDCGFATIATMAQVDPKIVWAKLASLGAGARLADERLATA